MELFHQISQDTLLLTPNRRLAAYHLNQYQQYQLSQGKTCWHSLDILPVNSWLERTWNEYVQKEISEIALRLSPNQELVLWEQIILQSTESSHLLQISETAEIAKSAWATLKQWQVGLHDSALTLTEDSNTFLKWAKQFQKNCRKNNWIDQNSLADFIIEKIRAKKIPAPASMMMIGFTEVSPQHQALLNICLEAGAQIDYYQQKRNNNNISYISLSDKEAEIRTMARWSKQLLESNPIENHDGKQALSIGCIIPNLEDHRATVSRIFTEVFTEPGQYSTNSLSLPFNISAGRSLASYPVIHTALQLLALNASKLSLDMLSGLLHSPFMGDAEKEMLRRADFDNQLRNDNLTQMTLEDLLKRKHKPELFFKRIKKFLDKLPPIHTVFSISEWSALFIELLTLLGWPGERSVNSEEYQVIQRWMELLSEFNSLEHFIHVSNYSSALHYLKRLTATTVFQPQSPVTPIQILGILEAAEIPFDYLWVMGLDDMAWPPSPKPNPFIPQQLQKTLNMPHATAERELLFCKNITEQLKNCAQSVIFSHPLHSNDSELRASSLLNGLAELSIENLALFADTQPMQYSFDHKKIETCIDNIAPPVLVTDVVRGGAKIFELQAACPFKAFAELRLFARPIETTSLGLRAFDRGNITHKALELMWAELKDSGRLHAMPTDELQALIQLCLEKAIFDVTGEEVKNVNYLALEVQRLQKILWNWMLIEKDRPPFNVIAQEQQYEITIANIPVSLRIDRIDELDNHEKLIIDYKTGKYNSVNDWFGDRPSAPQLPLYCLLDPENTVGIAFAIIHPEKMGLKGASQHPLHISSIEPLFDIKSRHADSWHEQCQSWRDVIEKLGHDFYAGHAEVDPKEGLQTCEHCNLKPFCRIYEKMTISQQND